MSGTTYYGQQTTQSGQSHLNSTAFLFQQLLSRVQTMMLVQVLAVTNAGGVVPAGTVDVQLLVGQVDGIDNVTPHGVVYGLPYQRIQGGSNAIIIDPQVGDIGAAGFCSRDISAVKASKAIAGPGSKRRFDHADGLYFGGYLNGNPTQYFQVSSNGIALVSPIALTFSAPNATLDKNGNLTVTGDVIASGISLIHHVHTNVQGGTGTTGPAIG